MMVVRGGGQLAECDWSTWDRWRPSDARLTAQISGSTTLRVTSTENQFDWCIYTYTLCSCESCSSLCDASALFPWDSQPFCDLFASLQSGDW
ncbi:hypothetical protein DAI22_06g065850 [Oryza sativa Japonica Group]|nr:hypothetical protein DAI22_06g065850 [Oryza sativa Japonica Group]